MIDRAGGARPRHTNFEALTKRPAKAASTFKQKTSAAVSPNPATPEASKNLGAKPAADIKSFLATRSPFANIPESRQNPVATPPRAAESAPAPAAPADPMAMLKEAMQKAGIDPGTVSLNITDEIIFHPAGNYRNHLINADFGSGVKESYSVDLMMKNPWLTAFEMKRLKGGSTS